MNGMLEQRSARAWASVMRVCRTVSRYLARLYYLSLWILERTVQVQIIQTICRRILDVTVMAPVQCTETSPDALSLGRCLILTQQGGEARGRVGHGLQVNLRLR